MDPLAEVWDWIREFKVAVKVLDPSAKGVMRVYLYAILLYDCSVDITGRTITGDSSGNNN